MNFISKDPREYIFESYSKISTNLKYTYSFNLQKYGKLLI